MSDVFISYSRTDKEFAYTLVAALQEQGIECWIDTQIPYGDDWWKDICRNIDDSENFIFIVTPESLQSKYCNEEIAYVRTQNKRIFPIIRVRVDRDGKPLPEIASAWFGEDWEETAKSNWELIKERNWFFFSQDDDFAAKIEELVAALRKDLEHVRFHANLQNRAQDWADSGRTSDNVLRGDDLETALSWELNNRDKEPHPTKLQLEYIEASRDEAKRQARLQRRRRAVIALLLLPFLLVGFYTVGRAISDELIRQEAMRANPLIPVVDAAGETLFHMDQYEVSVRQYQLCVQVGRCTPIVPEAGALQPVEGQMPVGWANAYQAVAFCRWLGRDLPTAGQWIVAATHNGQTDWPWGADIPEKVAVNANRRGSGDGAPVAVSEPGPEPPNYAGDSDLPHDQTLDGIWHLVGNMTEWTRSYAGGGCARDATACTETWDGVEHPEQALVLVGSSYDQSLGANNFAAMLVTRTEPGFDHERFGFRCVR